MMNVKFKTRKSDSFHCGDEWWEQRDSSEHCYGVRASGLSSPSDKPHFPLELEIKHLFMRHKDNQQLLNLYITKISESILNGLTDILLIIVDECKKDKAKLNKIREIIEDTKVNDTDVDTHNISKDVSVFDSLSCTSIQLICTFLNRDDIESFKSVSYDICILCLQHMNLYRFGICNVKKLIDHAWFYSNIYYLNYREIMNYDVYSPSRAIQLLQEHFHNMYDIPTKYQLLVSKAELSSYDLSDGCGYNSIDQIENLNLNTRSIQQFTMTKRRLFLFDTRSVVTIFNNDSEPKVLAECKELAESDLSGWKFHILQYFDVEKQLLYPVQTLLIHSSVQCQTILQYVQNTFIPTSPNEQKWVDNSTDKWNLVLYKSVCYDADNYPLTKERDFVFIKPSCAINTTPGTEHLTINMMVQFNNNDLYRHSLRQDDKNRNNRIQMLVIQMNEERVRNDSNIKYLKANYANEEKTFCENVSQFAQTLGTSTKIHITFLHKQSILKSYLHKTNSNHIQLESMLNILNNIELDINCLTKFGRLRIEISNLIHNAIPAKNIELYFCDDNDYLSVLPWADTLTIRDLNFCSERHYFFEFVTYDVTKTKVIQAKKVKSNTAPIKPLNNICRYYITIYTPNQSLVPKYQRIPSKQLLTFTGKYLSRFKLNNQFVKFIMDEISTPIYGTNFNEILNLYKSDNIMYAISDGQKMYYFNDEYVSSEDLILNGCLNKLSVLIFHNPNTMTNDKDSSNTVSITMRFDIHDPLSGGGCCGYAITKRMHHIPSGIPFKVWINEGDILKNVMSSYVDVDFFDNKCKYLNASTFNPKPKWSVYKAKPAETHNIFYADVFENLYGGNKALFEMVTDVSSYQLQPNEFIVIRLAANV